MHVSLVGIMHIESKKTVVFPLLFSGALVWSAIGCGGRDTPTDSAFVPCHPATAECLSSQIGQICDGQGRWATFQCAPSQVCVAGACAAGPDASTESCNLGEVRCLQKDVGQVCQGDHWEAFVCGAGQECRDGHCVSACTANERKCVTSSVVQVCPADGTDAVTVQCPTGAVCQSGECVGSCTPSARSCSATQVVRECRADGLGYVEHPCPDGGYCKDGQCAIDPSSECSIGDGVCLDPSTVLACKADGSGYETRSCTQGTSCDNGACVGRVCAVGSVECIPSILSRTAGLSTCNEDGNGYTISFCQANEVCFADYYTMRAKCYSAPCSRDDATCGEPETPGSPPHRLNRCEGLATGHLGWVTYECQAPAFCKEIDGLARCVSPCVPGTMQCGVDGLAIETCDPNGNWVPESCDQDGGGLVCVQVPLTGKVVCGESQCRKLQSDATTYKVYGVCSGKQIKRCGEDGRLGAPVDCDYGECTYEPFSSSRAICQGAK